MTDDRLNGRVDVVVLRLSRTMLGTALGEFSAQALTDPTVRAGM
ncbi:hypothetical protein [Actinopolyspora xinjiangensis]|nr:hypothetical protein [Actinopolyspora xinjiangensis]